MLAKIKSFAIVGIECVPVEVEVGISGGLPKVTIVGLGDTAIQEARERVRLAIIQSGFDFPRGKITINLAPADLKKNGPHYDLPIALGVLVASGQIPEKLLDDTAFVGELALGGKTRHINGALAIATATVDNHVPKLFLPKDDAPEASLIPGLEVYGISSLKEIADYAKGETRLKPQTTMTISDLADKIEYADDMSYIKGQEHAKRALEIAAAGSHNVLMNGAPGAGKTLLARTFRTILPKLTLAEALEVTKIYSISGILPKNKALVTERPFRPVHHTASAVSIVGGGTNPAPGEISLSHRGVLFLDELAEFPGQVLEVLRQPLEDHVMTVSRASGSYLFPAQFTLIAAMNPCPCGFFNVPNAPKSCTCTPGSITRYQKKISGPLMDRIDLYVDVPPVQIDKLTETHHIAESSDSIRERVQKARDIQSLRFQGMQISSNSEMSGEQIKEYCPLNDGQKEFLKQAMRQLRMSARGFHRILKLARTIADLEGAQEIRDEHLAEALQYRPKISEM